MLSMISLLFTYTWLISELWKNMFVYEVYILHYICLYYNIFHHDCYFIKKEQSSSTINLLRDDFFFEDDVNFLIFNFNYHSLGWKVWKVPKADTCYKELMIAFISITGINHWVVTRLKSIAKEVQISLECDIVVHNFFDFCIKK